MTKAKAGGEQPVEIPDTLPILPLRNSVLFPGAIIPIDVGRRKSVRLVEDAIAKERPVIGILTQKDARTEDPGAGDLYMVGCAARILKVIKLAKDNFSVILQGVSRFEVSTFDGSEPFLAAKVRSVPDPTSSDVELDALVMNLKDIAKRVVKLMRELPKEAGALVDSVTEAGHLADLITSHLELEVGEKQDVLETFDLKTRTRKVLQFLSRQLEVLKVRERINTQVQEEMGRNQREYVLRQQLKAIKEELGELDDGGGDLDEFAEKITKAKMPEEAEKVSRKQLDRLKGMQPSSAEYTVRRTYVGSLPGRVVQGIKKAGTNNPVFVLDEIDKLGHDFRGDPASALLEVLDPEQNSAFSDHYLEVTFDLSKVLFIATANQLDPIPWALRDRLEIIELPGYTRQEKKHIARKFLVPKQLEDHGLTTERREITDEAAFDIIASYTQEAGVRNLEREIGSVCRAVAVKVAEGQAKDHEVIDPKVVEEVLGPRKFVSEVAERVGEPGVATGLAWTAVGGDILFIEASRMPGKGKLTLTGQLGDVMKESVTAALSFVRGRAAALGLDPGNFLENTDLHVHVPAGAVPKDGPSAGITMYTALVSLFTGVPVRSDVAMTGEITLRGNVLQIGGVKEKLLAAHRAGIKRVIIPERNVKDLIDVPEEVKREMEILSVKRMDEVLALALKDPPPSILDLAKQAQADNHPTA